MTPESDPLASMLSNLDAYLVSSWMLPVMRCSLVPEVSVALLESLPSRTFDFLSVATQDAPWTTRMACFVEAGCQLILCSWAGPLGWCSIKGWPVEMAFHWRQWGLKFACHVWLGFAPHEGPTGQLGCEPLLSLTLLWPFVGAVGYMVKLCLLLQEVHCSHVLFAVFYIHLCKLTRHSGWMILFTFWMLVFTHFSTE